MSFVALGALLALGASGASAVVVQLGNGKAVSYQPVAAGSGLSALSVNPLAAGTSNLIYHGGPVMTSNTNYAFYWAPSGSPATRPNISRASIRYLENLAHDSGGEQNVDSVATQYANGGGEAVAYDSHFSGAIVDTAPYPKNGCKKAADLPYRRPAAGGAKRVTSPPTVCRADLAHEYFLLTPPGVEDCFEASGAECSAGSSVPLYCAYHGSFSSAGGEIVYANDPYVTGISGCDDGEHPNGEPSDGALQGGLEPRAQRVHHRPRTERLVRAGRQRERRQMPHLQQRQRIRHAARHRARRLAATTSSSTAPSTGTSRSGATKAARASSARRQRAGVTKVGPVKGPAAAARS